MASSYSTTCQRIIYNNAFNQASSCGFNKPTVGKQLLPGDKAHRADMLKSRFADLILKAQHTLNNNEEKEVPVTMRPEKVDFVKMKQKRNREIKSKVKVDKAVITHKTNSNLKLKIVMNRDATFLAQQKEGIDNVRLQNEKKDFEEKQQEKKRRIEAQVKTTNAIIDKTNLERKMKLEKERETVRLSLEKMEASVYFDDFNQTFKDFMMLISSQSDGVK